MERKEEMKKNNPHLGSYADDLWEEDEILEEITVKAIASTVAWILSEHLKETKKTKVTLAQELGTSRAQLNRLLDADRENPDMQLSTLLNVGKVTGKKLQFA